MENILLKKNFKRLLIVLLVIMGVVAISIFGYLQYRSTLENQALETEIARADRYLQAGELKKAAEIYRKIIDVKGKKDPELLKKLAIAEIGLKKRDSAEKIFKEIIEMNPKEAEAYFQLALIYYEKRDTTKAIEMAENASKLRATYIAPRYFLAKQYMIQEKYDLAIVKFNEIIKANPAIVSSQPEILKELAFCYEKNGNNEQAVFYYQQALKYLPGDADIILALKRLSNSE